MTLRTIASITATTDFHSNLDVAPALLGHLEKVRESSLIVDCGDFFEGTGYYRLTGGALEARILDGFYDVLAPGNHGWSQYERTLLRPITVCANVIDGTTTVFKPYFVTEVGGSRIGITGVMGTEAFATVPRAERLGQTALDPAQTLNKLFADHKDEADGWVLLSHSGFDNDAALAAACPWLNVIFSGHCHSARTGPAQVGRTSIVKAAELGRGVAVARPDRGRWDSMASVVPSGVVPKTRRGVEISQGIEDLNAELASPVGQVRAQWAGSPLDRDVLAPHIALAARNATGADVAVINHTALRSHDLGTAMTLGDLTVVEPFDARLTVVRFPRPQSFTQLTKWVEPYVGQLAVSPASPPATFSSLATTTYIAQTFLAEWANRISGGKLSDLVRSELCEQPGGGGSS